ncbi:MAG TPA: hypothetical protein VGI39_18540 [Polyangiaceae bacterium]|jgi:hypothetical protein
MEIVCGECGQKGKGTLGDLLVEGWVQRTEGKHSWVCPSCGSLLRTIPKIPSATPPSRGKV